MRNGRDAVDGRHGRAGYQARQKREQAACPPDGAKTPRNERYTGYAGQKLSDRDYL
nr:MAG TPA: hypothetical protein [Caudoviricetes sp.]